jgi:hypothetical protein
MYWLSGTTSWSTISTNTNSALRNESTVVAWTYIKDLQRGDPAYEAIFRNYNIAFSSSQGDGKDR